MTARERALLATVMGEHETERQERRERIQARRTARLAERHLRELARTQDGTR